MDYLTLQSHEGGIDDHVHDAVRLMKGMLQDSGVPFRLQDGSRIDRLTLKCASGTGGFYGIQFLFDGRTIRVTEATSAERLISDFEGWRNRPAGPTILGPCSPSGWLPNNRASRDLMDEAPPMWLSSLGREAVMTPPLEDTANVNRRMFAEPWARLMQHQMEHDAELGVEDIAIITALQIAPHLSPEDLKFHIDDAMMWLGDFWQFGAALRTWHITTWP